MATLIPLAHTEGNHTPFVWQCSECDFLVSLDRITNNPSLTQLQKVNGLFGVHCHHQHPNSPVVGLMIPAMDEDVAQTAFRVIREATENK